MILVLLTEKEMRNKLNEIWTEIDIVWIYVVCMALALVRVLPCIDISDYMY